MAGPPPIPPGGGGPPPVPPGGDGPPPPPPHGIGGGAPLAPLPNAAEDVSKKKPTLSERIFSQKISILSAGAMCIGAGIVIAATAASGGVGLIVLGTLIFSISAFFFVMAPWINIMVDEILPVFVGMGVPDMPQPLKDLASSASNMASHVFGQLDDISEKVKDWLGRR